MENAKPATIRHFATIGIEDVFLDCPAPSAHFFPQSYFHCNDGSMQRPFVSPEIIGHIKERPEDFCVREIAQKSRLVEIIGETSFNSLSDVEKRAVQVADLVELKTANDSDNQALSEASGPKFEKPKGDNPQKLCDWIGSTTDTKESGKQQQAVLAAEAAVANEKQQELSPLEIIKAVLEQVLVDPSKTQEILAELQSLQDRARKALQPSSLLDNNEAQTTLTSQEDDNTKSVYLPPIPKSFSSLGLERDSAQLSLLANNSIDRGAFHRAFRLEFFLLKTETIMPDQKIQVSIDDFFHDLIPFLHCPGEDLPPLYKFQKIGCVMEDAVVRGPFSTSRFSIKNHYKKRKRDNDETTPTDNNNYSSGDTKEHGQDNNLKKETSNHPILRLRPDLTKDERRPLHRMIQQKNRAFQTKTLSNVATTYCGDGDDDGMANKINDTAEVSAATTTAILVHWDPGAQKRARQKQKFKQNSGDGKKSSAADDHEESNKNIFCVLKKRGKEHLTALNSLCAAVKCRTSDVGLAGIKDMKAVTYQFCTIRNCRPGRLFRAVPALAEKGIDIGTIREVPTGIFLNNGDLEGNSFEIIIRGLRRVKVVESDGTTSSASTEDFIPCEKTHVLMMFERVKKHGFVNFYGEQRVGTPGDTSEVGVRTFDVGKAMLQGDFTKAIDLLMTGRIVKHSENSDEAKVRRVWQETEGDPVATLKVFPKGENMARERAVMKGLRRYGKSDPLAAIQCLPFNVRRFWINAYQSFVWNFMASARLRRFGSSSAILGDLFLEKDAATINDVQLVDPSNLSRVSLSQVVLPLAGFGVRYPENEIGDLYKEMLKKDSINFEKKGPDEGTAKGSYRHLIAKADNMQLETMENGAEQSSISSVKVSFDLSAGSYATMLLREMMLTTVTRV